MGYSSPVNASDAGDPEESEVGNVLWIWSSSLGMGLPSSSVPPGMMPQSSSVAIRPGRMQLTLMLCFAHVGEIVGQADNSRFRCRVMQLMRLPLLPAVDEMFRSCRTAA